MTPKAALAAVAVALAAAAAPPALAASLTVATITFPSDAQDFTYTAAGQPSIILDDDRDARHAAFREVSGLKAGRHEIVELPIVPGWTLVNVACVGMEGRSLLDRKARKVAVDLKDQSKATCTFIHQKDQPAP
jgi:hypothetical protein